MFAVAATPEKDPAPLEILTAIHERVTECFQLLSGHFR